MKVPTLCLTWVILASKVNGFFVPPNIESKRFVSLEKKTFKFESPRNTLTIRSSVATPENAVEDEDEKTDLAPRVQIPKFAKPRIEESCDITGITLTRYMMELVKSNPGGEMQELETLINSIQTACKAIGGLIRTASISGLTGAQGGGGSINVQGEEQKKMDVLTNDILKNCLKFTGKLNVLASEEEDDPVPHSDIVVDEASKFVAVFDPLDGSSNVDASIPTGTIFGIFRSDSNECAIDPDLSLKEQKEKCLVQTLQPGTNLVAAGYCLYSSSTHFVFTYGDGVNGFTLDPVMGEFILTHPNIRIPPRGKIYSFNEANRWDWDVPLQEYVTAIQNGEGESGVKYSSRYIGSMVGDIHRTLLYGGIFGYPADKKNKDGKLRLLYEAAPMSFLVEQAGGVALTGKNPIMLIKPKQVHTRVPCILGSQLDVMECQKYYEESTDPELIARCLKRMEEGSAL